MGSVQVERRILLNHDLSETYHDSNKIIYFGVFELNEVLGKFKFKYKVDVDITNRCSPLSIEQGSKPSNT